MQINFLNIFWIIYLKVYNLMGFATNLLIYSVFIWHQSNANSFQNLRYAIFNGIFVIWLLKTKMLHLQVLGKNGEFQTVIQMSLQSSGWFACFQITMGNQTGWKSIKKFWLGFFSSLNAKSLWRIFMVPTVRPRTKQILIS